MSKKFEFNGMMLDCGSKYIYKIANPNHIISWNKHINMNGWAFVEEGLEIDDGSKESIDEIAHSITDSTTVTPTPAGLEVTPRESKSENNPLVDSMISSMANAQIEVDERTKEEPPSEWCDEKLKDFIKDKTGKKAHPKTKRERLISKVEDLIAQG